MREERDDSAESEVDALRHEAELDEIEVYEPGDEYGVPFEIPDHELVDDPSSWCGWIPPDETRGETEPLYIEGILPNTTLTRQSLDALPKRMRRDPMIGLKEAQENLLRLCIKRIGDDAVAFKDLRGVKIDSYLTPKQMHYVTELFESLTTPDEADVEDFLSTVETGKRRTTK